MLSRFKVINIWLKQGFSKLGRTIARHPLVFLLVPLVLSCVLSSGMLRVEYSSDPDHLLTPINGEGRREKAIAEKFFPTNFSDFDAPRSTKFGLYGYVMVTAKNGNSILQPQIWSEVRRLQNIIVDITVEHEGVEYKYQDLCAKWGGECYTNSLLSFADTFAVLSRGVFRESVENYYKNYTGKFGFEVANNITKLSLETSKDIIDGVEKIKLLTNQTLEDIKSNLDTISSAVDGFSDLTNDLLVKYKTHLEPSFEGINLPAYFGGITLKNKSIETFDICEIISFMKKDKNSSNTIPCTHPLEIYSAITDFYQHSENEVFSSKLILDKVNHEIKQTLQQLNLRQSAQTFIGLLTNVSLSLEDFAAQVQDLLGDSDSIDINKMLEAEAVLIGGLLDSDMYPMAGEKWENKFLDIIDKLAPSFTTIDVAPLVSNSLKYEMVESVDQIKPILASNIMVMIVFCMAICFTKDITTSKPWVGFAGVISTLLATFASFGFLIYVGAEFTNFNFGAVFILIGIGLDDTFVLLNSWHRTDRKASVEDRLAETLSEAGVSIFITSVTNILSFYTAILAPYPYVKIFCLYTGTSLLLVFLFHLTFFCACLAYSGMCEEQDRSGLTFRVVEEKSRYQECLCLRMGKYRVNSSQAEKRKETREREDFLAKIVGKVLRAGTVRITVLFLYMAYICISIYGICNVVVYFDKTKLINHDSSMTAFVEVEDRLFRDKAFSISVIVSGNVNYTDPETVGKIDSLLERLEGSSYINQHLSRSWLNDFQTVNFILNKTNTHLATEREFTEGVYNFYKNSSSPFRLDVAYSADMSRIIASRFLIQGQNIHSTKEEENMVLEIRNICAEISDQDFKANVFNSYFPYTDQYLTIFGQSVQCILSTGVIVIAVSVVLLPDVVSAFSAILSIVSTLTGCLGFMSIWGIVLDGITLINLIMCIGFSVDFSAHFCYHYIDKKSKSESDDEIVERTLLSVWKPVLQGAISTLLGVVGMLYAPATSFVIFFKMMFIVITLGVVHSLILVPLLFRFILDLMDMFRDNCDKVKMMSEKDEYTISDLYAVTHM